MNIYLFIYLFCFFCFCLFIIQSRLSSCDDLYIDLSASTGSCGKAWEEAIWEINRTAADDANETLGVILENYLNTFFNRTLPQVDLPETLLFPTFYLLYNYIL